MKRLLLFLLFLPFGLIAQSPKPKNEVAKVIPYDLAPLLSGTDRSSILGFIGSDYQRFRIVFISVIKNNDNPSQYFVYGKSMVKGNVCDFQGTITIREATFITDDPEYENVKHGDIKGDYLFYEDPQQKHVGLFKGKFISSFYIDKHNKLVYDDLMGDADGYCNNMYTGTWSGYNSKTSKPCNWGDYRIPDSGDLDIGAGEFAPSEKYLPNGWLTYKQAYCCGDSPEAENAKKIETAVWWK